MSRVILGLGSNKGDRQAYLQVAVDKLAAVMRDIRVSRVLESPALLLPDAPKEWDKPFLNMAVSGVTDLAPQPLLAHIKALEPALGRVTRGVWGPREIDIDILAYGDEVMESAELTLPHSGLLKRDFALLPLIDVAPDWRHPAGGPHCGQLAADIAAREGFCLHERLRDTGIVIHA